MIKQLHNVLVSNPLTRRVQRKIVRQIKHQLSVPDAPRDLAALIKRTSPDAVLDIGCHVGNTIARILESSRVPIYGFEPTKETFEKLSRRFEGNELVNLYNVALSDKNGEAKFYCNANEQTNSLLDNDEGNERALQDATRHVDSQIIQTQRLDDWMKQHLPDGKVVVKCDVQGAEGLLIAGGMDTFRSQIIGFYSEAQIVPMYKGQADFCQLHKLLTEELGFVLHNIYPCLHDAAGRALQTDAFWIHERYLESAGK